MVPDNPPGYEAGRQFAGLLCLVVLVGAVYGLWRDPTPATNYRTAAELGGAPTPEAGRWALDAVRDHPCDVRRSISDCLADIRRANDVVEIGWDVVDLFTDTDRFLGVEYRVHSREHGEEIVFEWALDREANELAPLNRHTRDITWMGGNQLPMVDETNRRR